MNKYFTVSKVIIKPLILSSAFISIFMTHVSFAQNNADLQLKSVHEQAYEKMSQFDHPNGMDLADLHHVIFSKNKEQLHEFLVHANYDEVVESNIYKHSNPNAQDLVDTMGSLEKYSDEELVDAL